MDAFLDLLVERTKSSSSKGGDLFLLKLADRVLGSLNLGRPRPVASPLVDEESFVRCWTFFFGAGVGPSTFIVDNLK